MVEIKEIFYDDVLKHESKLIQLLKMVFDENYPEIDTYQIALNFYKNMVKYSLDKSAILFGAFDGNKLIGVDWAHESIFVGKRRMHNYMLAIDPMYRGQHIGNDFLAKLEEYTLKKGITEIEAFCKASNPIAVNYHLHNGFEIENHRVVKVLIPNNTENKVL